MQVEDLASGKLERWDSGAPTLLPEYMAGKAGAAAATVGVGKLHKSVIRTDLQKAADQPEEVPGPSSTLHMVAAGRIAVVDTVSSWEQASITITTVQ